MRCTVTLLTPVALAIVRTDQCVALAGVSRVVLAITSASFATRTDGVRPLRGASCSIPASRSAANRFRQVPTVRRVHPRSAAISSFRRPTAAARTILALKHQSRRRTPPARPFRHRRSFFRRHCDALRNPHGMILRGWSIRRQNPQIRSRTLETLHSRPKPKISLCSVVLRRGNEISSRKNGGTPSLRRWPTLREVCRRGADRINPSFPHESGFPSNSECGTFLPSRKTKTFRSSNREQIHLDRGNDASRPFDIPEPTSSKATESQSHPSSDDKYKGQVWDDIFGCFRRLP